MSDIWYLFHGFTDHINTYCGLFPALSAPVYCRILDLTATLRLERTGAVVGFRLGCVCVLFWVKFVLLGLLKIST